MATRTPEEIRRSIESNRAELALSLGRLRGEVAEVTDWRKQIVRHRKQVVIGAAVAGVVIGGGNVGRRAGGAAGWPRSPTGASRSGAPASRWSSAPQWRGS